MSFRDCELAIMRSQSDKAQTKISNRVVTSKDIDNIIQIVEDFLKTKKLICYGGTAINNILPKEAQFYNKETEIADYDFFTTTAMDHAKELADIFIDNGFIDVEAKAGQHFGTYKVFVNFIPVADITQIPRELFNALKNEAIIVSGILYPPPNFLRMSMYLELSRPAGDTSRWEKVLKRITLLNKYYPMTVINCDGVEFQRKLSVGVSDNSHAIFKSVKETLISEKVVFIGGFAMRFYSKYMPRKNKHQLKTADFDVISRDPKATAATIVRRLTIDGVEKIKVVAHKSVGETVPMHYEIIIGGDTVAFIYKSIACHSYNAIKVGRHTIRVGTIDTMLSFYLAFLYTNRPYFNEFSDRIMCMSKYLFDVQQKNRLSQKGVLKRFSINCYGRQLSVEDMRAEKSRKYRELSRDKKSTSYQERFLNYKPGEKLHVVQSPPGTDTSSVAKSSTVLSSSSVASTQPTATSKTKKAKKTKTKTKKTRTKTKKVKAKTKTKKTRTKTKKTKPKKSKTKTVKLK